MTFDLYVYQINRILEKVLNSRFPVSSSNPVCPKDETKLKKDLVSKKNLSTNFKIPAGSNAKPRNEPRVLISQRILNVFFSENHTFSGSFYLNTCSL